jgi:hypothetical protein
MIGEVQELIEADKIDEAEKCRKDFFGIRSKLTRAINPLDPKVLIDHYEAKEAGVFTALSFPGVLGELIGALEREWLVAVLGSMKKGKSFLLQLGSVLGAIQKKRVVVVNLEMNQGDMIERNANQLIGIPETLNGQIYVPTFDCVCNQYNQCPVPHFRKNKIPLCTKDTNYKLPSIIDADRRYKPCMECRKDPDRRDRYMPTTWYLPYKGEKVRTLPAILRTARTFTKNYGDRLRHITYPAYSITMADLFKDLDSLIFKEGFIPDIVILDYGDILKPEGRSSSERDRLSEDWKNMKRWAGEHRALWLTATQTNRMAIDKTTISQKDIAEDIRKLAHVDVMVGIHQTDDDKTKGLSRLSVLANRHRKFDKRQVMILHQLDLGLPYIDSEWVPIKHDEKEETNDDE